MQAGDCDGVTDGLTEFVQVCFERAGTIEQRMLEFISEIEGVGQSQAASEQPDGEEDEDSLPDEPIHRLEGIS